MKKSDLFWAEKGPSDSNVKMVPAQCNVPQNPIAHNLQHLDDTSTY